MRREINIGNRTLDIECNNGTALLFQEFTGLNLYDVITSPASKLTDLDKIRDLNAATINKLEDPETAVAFKKVSSFANEAVAVAQKLAYVMNLQAQNNKTLEGISEIRKKLNADDFLVWLMQFDPTDFSASTYKTITAFWRKQSEGSSEAKN